MLNIFKTLFVSFALCHSLMAEVTLEEVLKAGREGRLSEVTTGTPSEERTESPIQAQTTQEITSSEKTSSKTAKKKGLGNRLSKVMKKTTIDNSDPRGFSATYEEEATPFHAGAFLSLSLGAANSDFQISSGGQTAEADKNTIEGTLIAGFKTNHKSIGQLELGMKFTHFQYDEDEALIEGFPGTIANHYVPEGMHRLEPYVTYRSSDVLPVHWLLTLGARKHIVVGENQNNVTNAVLYQEDLMGVIGTGFDIHTDSPFTIHLGGDIAKGSHDEMYSATFEVRYQSSLMKPYWFFKADYSNYKTDYTEPVLNRDNDIEIRSRSLRLGMRMDF